MPKSSLTSHALDQRHQAQDALLLPEPRLRHPGQSRLQKKRALDPEVYLGLLLREVAESPSSNPRAKPSKSDSIESPNYADFKTCIEELKIMNRLYNTFKANNKNIKSKNKKFMDFYRSNAAKKVSDLSMSEGEDKQDKLDEARAKSKVRLERVRAA